jgi:DNA invertase Pin-like site-specific DNA recombinase
VRLSGNGRAVKAGIYCRLSLQRDGDTTKVDDQERICRRIAGQLGWEIAEGVGYPSPDGVYTDNNESAWKLKRKRRGWDAMLADVGSGKISALIVYHGDRLIRQPRDLEDLIDLARARGTRLASGIGTRDLGNPDDQFILRIEAAAACRASDDTSRRQKARFDRWRLEGREFAGGPGGRRFGFGSDGVTPVPAEGDAIREAAARILGGESARSLAKDFGARGITSVTGRAFDGQDLRRMLKLPRYAGLMADGETRAAWEPVLDRETWERVVLVLEARGVTARKGDGREVRHLLSGIAACGRCGARLQIAYISTRGYKYRLYACGRRAGCGKLYRNADHLDAYVIARTTALLRDPRQPEGELPVAPDHAPEWLALSAERAETEKAVTEYATSPGRLTLLNGRLDSIDKRMAELREREAGDARSRLLGHHRGITGEQFAALPLDVRRALVAASYRVTVLPASGRGPGFRTEDVRLDPL